MQPQPGASVTVQFGKLHNSSSIAGSFPEHMGPLVRSVEDESTTMATSLPSSSSFGLWEALLSPPPWQQQRTSSEDGGSDDGASPPLTDGPLHQGIVIPAFLQPLLGLDFVPYLPSPTDGGTATSRSSPSSENEPYTGMFRHTSADAQDDTETELEEIDACLEETRCQQQEPRKDGKKKRFGENRKLIPKALVKTLSSIKKKNAGRLLPKRSDSSGREQEFPSDSIERTPRRRGRPQLMVSTEMTQGGSSPMVVTSSPVSPQPSPGVPWTVAADSNHRKNAPSLQVMEQQWQTLQSLQQQAVQVRRQAMATEDRIAMLVQDAAQLQQALAVVYRQMNDEQSRLTAVQTQLHHLNDRVNIATQQWFTQNSTNVSPPQRSLRPHKLPPTSSGGRQRSRAGSHSPHNSWHSFRTDDSFDATAGGTAATGQTSPPYYGTPTTNRMSTPQNNVGRRRRANTDPPSLSHALLKSSSSFMRVNDLELQSTSSTVSIGSSLHSLDDAIMMATTSLPGGSSPCMMTPPGTSPTSNNDDDLFLLDENLPFILSRLTDLGLQMSTDETDRFSPISDTSRIVQQKKSLTHKALDGWPYSPWHVAKDKDILLWTGGVPHKGFGHDWPVVKARCIVRTSPRELLDFLLDSSQLKRYNKMSQGREDVLVLQDGVDTRAEDSPYGFPGDARIMRALNKPKLLPKVIEMLSLWYSRTLPDAAPNAYMTVSRSVWENASGTPQKNNHRLRSEMLLGVNLLRPCPEGCELTTITHVFAPGVPEMMAKRVAPQSAANMMREIQSIFA